MRYYGRHFCSRERSGLAAEWRNPGGLRGREEIPSGKRRRRLVSLHQEKELLSVDGAEPKPISMLRRSFLVKQTRSSNGGNKH